MTAVLYHGTRDVLSPGELVTTAQLYFSPALDAAIWAAELAEGEQEPRVYRVAASGSIEDMSLDPEYVRPPHPAMSWRTPGSLTVLDEVVEWRHYHGTRASREIGDLIEPGHSANFGPTPRTANFVYFTRTLDASIWGAELAVGDAKERIYVVEPTGPFEDDPNLTNARFRGNPTKSFRSRAPLRVIGELLEWQGHSPDVVLAMKTGIAQSGATPNDD